MESQEHYYQTLLLLGPCYGELGTGEKFRNQGVPKKSKEFEYANILKVNYRLEATIKVA